MGSLRDIQSEANRDEKLEKTLRYIAEKEASYRLPTAEELYREIYEPMVEALERISKLMETKNGKS
jgi:hypothetical protein